MCFPTFSARVSRENANAESLPITCPVHAQCTKFSDEKQKCIVQD